MDFELVAFDDFYLHFGDGYCIDFPSTQDKLDMLTRQLSELGARWRFYASFRDGTWHHGVHITFPWKDSERGMDVMGGIIRTLGLGDYACYDGFSAVVIDADGDLVSFMDFTEAYDV